MKTLHGTFQELAAQLPTRLASELIAKKIAEHGVVLSAKRKEQVRRRLVSQDLSSIRIPDWRWWKTRQIHIEITPDDIAAINAKFESWLESLPRLLVGLVDELALTILPRLKKRWKAESRRQRRDSKAFEKRLQQRWRGPLEQLSMLLTVAREFGEGINIRLRGSSDNPHLIETLTRLHARSCQVASEVLALLKSGFADGAIARWRTLHEIAVTALFIAEHGQDVAERYLLHETVESYRAAGLYERYYQRLGCEPIDSSDLNRLKASFDTLVARYGPEFGEPYGWAARHLNKANPTFADIERAVSTDHLRPYYKMASYNVHANPKGVLFKLGLTDQAEVLLAGASNFGLADPGQNTALSMTQVSAALGQVDPTLDSIVTLKIMTELSHEVASAFVEGQTQMEENAA